MDKEKILSQNKKENLYLDEYEKHIKLQGKSFGLMFGKRLIFRYDRKIPDYFSVAGAP